MTFREIKINELLNFIASDFYKNSDIIPISPQRAISQSKNPNSNDDDVALILALDSNDSIIGYIGILPGKISIDTSPYCWNSCWWVHPEKGKMAAMPLFYKMLKISNKKMVFFELTKTTKTIIEKFDFKTKTIQGLRNFLKFNFTEILPRKNNSFKAIKPLLFLLDLTLNYFKNLSLNSYKNITSIELKTIKGIDDEAELFIARFNEKQLIPINKTEINWIIKYPWIIDSPSTEDKKLARNYFFSWVSKSFSNELFKVYRKNQLIGVLFFTIRNNEMKLPYSFFEEQEIESIIQAIYHIAIKKDVISFTTFNPAIIDKIITRKNPFIINKSITKYVAYPKNCIALGIENKQFQDGNGDAVFC